MALRIHFRSLLLALAVTTAAGAAFAGPAAAKSRNYWDHPIYNDRQGWAYVDQDHDGHVSKSEWKWAEKHGYDRLTGVPKKHLTRKEYQRYLDAYLEQRQQRTWRKADSWDRNRDGDWRGNNNRYTDPRQDDRYQDSRYQDGRVWYYNSNGGRGKH